MTKAAKTTILAELPKDERGLSNNYVQQLDSYLEKLQRKGLSPDQREAIMKNIAEIERKIDLLGDQSWRDRTANETASLAASRGEEVERSKSGAVRVNSRDALLAMVRKGHLTADQYQTACDLRDAYEARSEGVGSQLGAINGVGGGHNNDRYVLSALRRAKALQRIGTVERAILLSPLFAENGSQSHVGLQMVRAVCGQGVSLSSQGEGRAFERNLLALTLALDVARELR